MVDVARRPISERDEANRDLVVRHRAGDPDALAELIEANKGVVRRIARRIRLSIRTKQAWEEARAQAALGFVEAARDFDLDSGRAFTTYLDYKVARQLRELLRGSFLLHVPKDAFYGTSRIRRQETRDLARQARGVRKVSSSEITGLLAACPKAADPSLALDVQTMLAVLTDRERQVIEHEFGLNGRPELGQSRQGQALGVSKARVWQLKVAALGRLRERFAHAG